MKKNDYEEYQRRSNNLHAVKPKIHTSGTYTGGLDPYDTPSQRPILGKPGKVTINNPMPFTKPQRTVHPAIIIAILDAIILLAVPSLRLYAGLTLAIVALSCMAFVGVGMIRRAGR